MIPHYILASYLISKQLPKEGRDVESEAQRINNLSKVSHLERPELGLKPISIWLIILCAYKHFPTVRASKLFLLTPSPL